MLNRRATPNDASGKFDEVLSAGLGSTQSLHGLSQMADLRTDLPFAAIPHKARPTFRHGNWMLVSRPARFLCSSGWIYLRVAILRSWSRLLWALVSNCLFVAFLAYVPTMAQDAGGSEVVDEETSASPLRSARTTSPRATLFSLSFPLKTGPLHWPQKGELAWQGSDIQTKTS